MFGKKDGRVMGEWMSGGTKEQMNEGRKEAGDGPISSRTDGADGLSSLLSTSSHLLDGFLSCLPGPEEIEKTRGIHESQ